MTAVSNHNRSNFQGLHEAKTIFATIGSMRMAFTAGNKPRSSLVEKASDKGLFHSLKGGIDG
jgi:hypothetical protein